MRTLSSFAREVRSASQPVTNKTEPALFSASPVVTTFQSELRKNEGKNTWENCDVLDVCGQQESLMFIYLCRKFPEEKWEKQPDLTSADDCVVWTSPVVQVYGTSNESFTFWSRWWDDNY